MNDQEPFELAPRPLKRHEWVALIQTLIDRLTDEGLMYETHKLRLRALIRSIEKLPKGAAS